MRWSGISPTKPATTNFYDHLNIFTRTLAIALSSHEFANDPAYSHRIDGYRNGSGKLS
jgi:hypothetical protein